VIRALAPCEVATLNVSDISLQDDSIELFTVTPSQAVVVVDELITITVSFQPAEQGDVSARLTISSDDPDEPEITVLLNGAGVP
jgi:hypothetical protein